MESDDSDFEAPTNNLWRTGPRALTTVMEGADGTETGRLGPRKLLLRIGVFDDGTAAASHPTCSGQTGTLGVPESSVQGPELSRTPLRVFPHISSSLACIGIYMSLSRDS